MDWAPQQQAIFGWFADGQGNLVVRARAGTGKTTTILEAINHAPEHRILLCAFNKDISVELSTRLENPDAEAKTLHSAGYQVLRSKAKGLRLDAGKGQKLAAEACDLRKPTNSILTLISKLASLGKAVEPLTATCESLEKLASDYNLEPDEKDAHLASTEMIAEWAMHAMNQARKYDGTIDYDDMIFLPLVLDMVQPRYDMIVVDEAQDMNASQLLLAQRLLLPNGRMVVVGDDRQAIYKFRGADTDAIDRLKVELDAAELPLTTTYRCPWRIVDLAKELVPDYQAAPSAPEGLVEQMMPERMLKEVVAGDFILSRLNAPLMPICMALLREGRPAKVAGRDIAGQLTGLVRRHFHPEIAQLLANLEAWCATETEKVLRSKKSPAQVESRLEYLNDMVQVMEALSEGMSRTEDLLARISDLFIDEKDAEKKPVILCSTIHRVKGKEAKRVFLLAETLYCRGKRGGIEEINLHYVGVTRAKETLSLVGPLLGPPKETA
jgi:superfamily I DNA/RNA helicase